MMPLDEATTNRLLDTVVQALKAYDPEKIILFGSVARGEADQFSDLDLIIIKKTEKRFVHRLVEAGQFLKWPRAGDIFVYTPEEFQAMLEEGNPFIERGHQEGRVLYEKVG